MINPPTTGAEATQDDKTMGMLAAILGIVTSFVGPLIIFLIKKDQSKFAAFYGLQSTILEAALFAVAIVGVAVPFIGGLFWLACRVIGLIFGIQAAIAANKGSIYEIPVAGKIARQQVGI